ncbi:MAG TPA: type VI secretion system ATPase TssH [Blastocatellia bacterium]|nr:type VI secretion system ATPase TssH [Blastocatellia bacterium]
MELNLKALIAKLNDTCRVALEGAAGLCLARTNYEVDVEHVLIKLLEPKDSDVARILRYCEIDPSRLSADLAKAMERLKTGNARTPALSPRIARLIEDAWLIASVDFGAKRVRSGHLFLAMMAGGDLARLAREISSQFEDVVAEQLKRDLPSLVTGSPEDQGDPDPAASKASASDAPPMFQGGARKALEQFTINLTQRARAGQIDPVLGREFEIRQVVDILTRRRQNNPILTGEAGVGKTAIVEGFALRIVQGDVPPPLRNVTVCTLDLGLLQAGAGIKGEFENRLKSVIEEVKSSPQPIILFIDEAHTMIGAGGQAGQSDAANLLKPALARGELRTIAATTWAEYKKYFEKDAALSRRFQVVKVEEPNEEQGIIMMRGLAETLESHHKVRILDEAIEGAVRLSNRYITGRQLPDKSVSVLDTACARVAIGLSATPPSVEDAERRIGQLNTEIAALEREAVTGADHGERINGLIASRSTQEQRLAELRQKWETERSIVAQIQDVRLRLEQSIKKAPDDNGAKAVAASAAGAGNESPAAAASAAEGAAVAPALDVEALRTQLAELNQKLEEIQGEAPLVQACVTSQTIAEVISGWTGIPVGRMLADEIKTVLSLAERLGQRVVGQSRALESIAQRIRTSRANLTDPRRPVGVFLLVGPSGVGKTETALALAEALYGGERNLITINMSEYQEAHTVSGLKGSPPGYVGYGEGGVLTEAVRRKPYSVVLLDEAEKAHPDVMELFYQVFDKGMLEDGEGREIDFKNTVILLTANTGTDLMMKLCADPDTRPDPEGLVESIRPQLLKVFKPALLGRMATVPYYPITDEFMREIVKLQLGRVGRRVADNHGALFGYDDAVVNEIAGRCNEVESGARNVDHILTRTLLPEMSEEFLGRLAAGQAVSMVQVRIGEAGRFSYEIS